MPTKSETRNCQNCKTNFVIEPEDFEFYEKIKVPAPTFCPECRFQRRLMFRNERVLYKRKCDLCGEESFSIFSPDKPYTVYCNPCWWSDKWYGGEYGIEYNPQENFFIQFDKLLHRVPLMALVVDYATLVNSPYTNHSGHLKDCYWLFDADFSENSHYATTVVKAKDSMDLLFCHDVELVYEAINCQRCSRVYFSEDCSDSHDLFFSKNLVGCSNCFGSINLKNKQYHIFNQSYSKEEYEKRLGDFMVSTYSGLRNAREEAYAFWRRMTHKYIHGRHNVNVSGDYITNSKNAHFIYLAEGVEDSKFCQRLSIKPTRDSYDYTEWGNNASRIYEGITVGEGVDMIRFAFGCFFTAANIEYSIFCMTSHYLFGCVGLRKKEYCILNKQYSKEEYERLVSKIKQQMADVPYIDKKGRKFPYGEFFPYDLSFFGYNESTAGQYFPLGKNEAEEKGFPWYEGEIKKYEDSGYEVPDAIAEVKDDILQVLLTCKDCRKNYRLIPAELELLRKQNLPVPRECPECRHRRRMASMNPPRLWDRNCAKCNNPIKTSYASDRPEIVYCEQCYQNEVV